MKIGHILLIGTMILIAGCVCNQTTTADNDITTDATAQLAEAAAAVSHSLSELAVVSRATAPPCKVRLPCTDNCPGLSNLVSIDWSGPVEPLVKRLSDAAGYKFRALGVRPAIPAIVTISAKNTTIGSLLRDVAFQSGGKIKIYVMPNVNVIELRYVDT